MSGYLEELEAHLKGRMPQLEVDQAVMEARSHLYELIEEQGGIHTAGSTDRAVTKFGPAKRLARRLLLARETVPSPWRAAAWPLGLVLLYYLFMILVPVQVLERLTFSGQLSERWLWLLAAVWTVALGICIVRRRLPLEPLGWLLIASYLFGMLMGPQSILWVTAVGTWLVVMRLFWAARQLLWKPLLAAATLFLVVAVLIGPMFHFVAVGADGSTRVVNRAFAADTRRGIGFDLSELDKLSATLRRGEKLFRGATPTAVTPDLKVGDFYLSPQDLMERSTSFAGPPESEIPPPLFVQTTEWPSDRVSTWSETVGAWSNIEPYLARIADRKAQLQSYHAAMPADEHAGYWITAARLTKPWASLTLRAVLVLFEMNLITWLLWLVSRRIVWPRRRFA